VFVIKLVLFGREEKRRKKSGENVHASSLQNSSKCENTSDVTGARWEVTQLPTTTTTNKNKLIIHHD